MSQKGKTSEPGRDRRLRVLILNFDFRHFGGVETYTYELATQLHKNNNVKVIVACTAGRLLERRLKAEGVATEPLFFPDHLEEKWQHQYSRFVTRIFNPWLLGNVFSIIRKVKPDVIQVDSGWLENFHWQALGIPVIQVFHGTAWVLRYNSPKPIVRLFHKAIRPFYKWSVARMAERVFVSRAEQVNTVGLGVMSRKRAGIVIYNGVNIQNLQRHARKSNIEFMRSSLGCTPETVMILYPSRLEFDKNPDDFLTLVERVANTPDSPSVHWVVAGAGSEKERILEAIEAMGLTEQVTFLGFRQDIPELVACCDLTVNTSTYEAFGLTIVESLALGKPCVCYAGGGVAEIMDFPDGKAMIAPPGDIDTLAHKLIQMIRMPRSDRDALAQAYMARAEEFSTARQAAEYEALYERVVAYRQK